MTMRHHVIVAHPDYAIERAAEHGPLGDKSVTIEVPMSDEVKAAAQAFIDGRLQANESWAGEVPMTPLERRQLEVALGLRYAWRGSKRFCAGWVARRPRHRQHGARGRGVGGRRCARDGGSGDGDADPEPPSHAQSRAHPRDPGVGGPKHRREGRGHE
jgi:hypothetical protein